LTGGPDAKLKQILAGLPTRHMARLLVRCVPQLDFDAGKPRRYLLASGLRNRCNPRDVACLYFSEEEETARAAASSAGGDLRPDSGPSSHLDPFKTERLSIVTENSRTLKVTSPGFEEE